MWLGIVKKYLKLRSNELKRVKFNLGVLSNGVYEVGNPSDSLQQRTNLFDTNSSIFSGGAAGVSGDEYYLDESDTASISNKLNTSFHSNNYNSENSDGVGTSTAGSGGGIYLYAKNAQSGRYELVRRLNPISMCVYNRNIKK
jgi:hypothetical protein